MHTARTEWVVSEEQSHCVSAVPRKASGTRFSKAYGTSSIIRDRPGLVGLAGPLGHASGVR